MSYLIKKEDSNYGIMIHVPKCAGGSSLRVFENNGYNLTRPNKSYTGHFTLKQTLDILKKDFSIEDISRLKFYIGLRDPISLMESFYKFSIEYPITNHGLKWEHENFERIGIDGYINLFLSNELITNEHNILPYRKLNSYFSLEEYDIDGLNDCEVILYTNVSIEKIIDTFCEDHKKNYNIPITNSTSKKKFSYSEEIKDKLYKSHFGKYDNMFKTLLTDKFYKTTFRYLV